MTNSKKHSKAMLLVLLFTVVAVIVSALLYMDRDHPKSNKSQEKAEIEKLTPTALKEVPPLVKPTRAPSLSDERPNVVLMLVDDMRTADLAYMPKLKKLVGETGVTFPNMISPNPLCCPARSTLVTGQYTHNNGVFTNEGYFGGLRALKDPDNTLPVWLSKAGYQTAFFGKYLNGYGKSKAYPKGWTWWDATDKGTYAYTRFTFENNGNPQVFTDDYITTRLRERSDALIQRFSEEREATGQPFFIYDSYVAPHGSINAPKKDKRAVGPGPIPEKKYRDLYKDEINPSSLKPSFGVDIKNVDNEKLEGARYHSEPLDALEAKQQQKFLNRIRSLASVDDAVEATVEQLKESGQYENTVLIFMSDNGYMLGEHKRTGKQMAYKESLSVPLIISGPGFAQNETSQRWATTADVVQTILDLAEATPERTQDGLSLKKASAGDPAPQEPLLIENGNNEARLATDEPWHYHGVLLGTDYTYVEWANGALELYDNKKDPYQLVNVAGLKKYRAIEKLARQQLKKLKDCSGTACRPNSN